MGVRYHVLAAMLAPLLVPCSTLPAWGAVDLDPVAHPPSHVARAATKAPAGYTPAQIRHAYGFDQLTGDGSRQVIGIVDAHDDPTVGSDLQTFIGQFGLPAMQGLPNSPACTVAAGPHPCFQKAGVSGSTRLDPGWALEIALDVEWAHVVAPGADILLVESPTANLSSLFRGTDLAVAGGARVVSMSWGAAEFPGETRHDAHFTASGVTFVAAAGDFGGGGVLYPAASPTVIGVGGTTLPLDATGSLIGPETAWRGSGGGVSSIESEPPYQSSYAIPATGGKRGIPDVAFDADPTTGVAVFNASLGGWIMMGGTSVGTPQWAALIALADAGRNTPLTTGDPSRSPIYDAATGSVYAANYRDIVTGSNGTCGICTASTGYDFVTGLGSPLAGNLVPFLQARSP